MAPSIKRPTASLLQGRHDFPKHWLTSFPKENESKFGTKLPKNKRVFHLWKTLRPPPILHPKRLAELVQAIDAAILGARRAGLRAEGMAEGHKPLRQLLRAQRGAEWGRNDGMKLAPQISNLSSLSFQSASRSLDAIKVSFMNIPGMAGMGPPS